jgi:hypothetical protein
MQSTINFALSNAFAKLNLSDDIRDRTIANLWRDYPTQSRAHSPARSLSPPSTPPAVNLEKLNRQQVQRLGMVADDSHDSSRDEAQLHKDFLVYINALPSSTFKSLSLLDHMFNFFAATAKPAPKALPPLPASPPASQPASQPQPQSAPQDDDDEDVVDVNFHMREYVVGIKTHRIYELRGGVHVFVGMLGMNDFEDMVMPEIEDE